MDKIKGILRDVKRGKPIIIVDSLDRENEGDLMIAAKSATVENIAFMLYNGRGIMCLPCDGNILDDLKIPLMVENNTDRFCTPFTISVDAKDNVHTGVSAKDRLQTISIFLNPDSKPEELVRPGHLFPLRAHKDWLAGRKGHTEASVVLAVSAGLPPIAVISEIMNKDGSMARLPELQKLAKRHKLKIVSIEEICG